MAKVPRPVLVWLYLGNSPTTANLRMLWHFQKERSKTGAQTDIFEIEAIGPLIALLTWPQLLADRPWIHFIDNTAAQGALIKGSSNSLNGDIIAGETWGFIRKVRCWLWMG